MTGREKELIQAVRDYAGTDLRPTKQRYEEYARRSGAPSIEELYDAFGSWRGVCDAADFDCPAGAPPLGSRDAATASLKRAYGDMGIYTKRQYIEWSKTQNKAVSVTSILRIFGTWKTAMTAAGLAVTRERRLERGPELEALIRKVCNGQALSVREWNDSRGEGVPSARSIALTYDGSWPAALEASGIRPVHLSKTIAFANVT